MMPLTPDEYRVVVEPRHRLTAKGRTFVAVAIIVPAFLATCTLIFNPI